MDSTATDAKTIDELRAMVERSRLDADRLKLALAAGAIVGTWFWDVLADRFTVDEPFARAFGLDPALGREGLSLKKIVETVHPEDRADLMAAIEEALARGGRYAHQYRVCRTDGQYHWIEANGHVVHDESGRPISFPGVLIEVGERRRIETERDSARALLTNFVEAMPGVVYAKDRDGRLVIGNHGTSELIGKAPHDFIGRTDLDILEDKQQAAMVMATDRRIMASGRSEQVEEDVNFPDGRRAIWLSTKSPLRDADGTVVGLVGTSLDITERKAIEASHREIEERYRLAIGATSDIIWDWRLADGHVVWNEALVTRFGHAQEQTSAQWWLDHIHPDDRARIEASIHAVIDHGGTSWTDEYRFERADGSYAFVLDRGAVLRSDDGAPLRMIGAMLDQTERKAAEAQLLELNERLELRVAEEVAERTKAEDALRQSQKMEAVGQLTGGIAHDFNNMLAVVVGSLDLLTRRMSDADARARRYVDAAMDGARRAAQLTQRLLAFSRQQPLKPETIDANKLVAGMSDLLRHTLPDIQPETVLAGGLWRTFADPNQLENVILNLAVNARDAMTDGGRLTIETANCHLDARYAAGHLGVPAGQYVMIAVSDTGSGMSEEVIAKAFDPFFTTKEVGRGTGLGLSQVYGFVKQSGGHVKIYSEVGQGTTVKVYLPRLMDAVEEVESARTDNALPLGESQEVILVVEDEPGVRQFSVDALTELGYRVFEADGAAAALKLIDAHPEIALMFTDVVMPEVNGRKLADEARQRRPDLKVLFTTGYTRNAVVHNGVLDPGVHLIGKPFTVEELAKAVRLVIEEDTG